MYWPTHRDQLTGIATQAVDCGVRATQMAVDFLSKGQVVPSVKRIRAVMDDQDTTNYQQWDDVIDTLGGDTLGFAGEKTNSWKRVRDHMNAAGAGAILAVHYGTYRRSMPAKSGSLTFDDYHAIAFFGSRVASGARQWRSFDSLLDGRYRGCPNGPVWVLQQKVKLAALEVGKREGGEVYAVLLHRDPTVQPIEPGDLLPDAGMTLGDVLADLTEIGAATKDPKTASQLADVTDALSDLIGIVGNPEADADTPVAAGVSVS